jgi:hypothetical protein
MPVGPQIVIQEKWDFGPHKTNQNSGPQIHNFVY